VIVSKVYFLNILRSLLYLTYLGSLCTGNSGSSVTERTRVRSNSRSVVGSTETPVTPAPSSGGSGRPRGRPKKRPLDEAAIHVSPVSEPRKSGMHLGVLYDFRCCALYRFHSSSGVCLLIY